MVRREKCPQCNKDVEVDKEIIIENPYEITTLLKCGHRRKEVVRGSKEHLSVSDSMNAEVRYLISFESEEDRKKGLYALISSKSRFNGIDKNKFLISKEQSELLKSKHIKYRRAGQ